jgi:alkylresorcinol/alkylpyrone synthase
MTVIAAAQGALPDHTYRQEEITDALVGLLDDDEQQNLLRRVHVSSRVRARHLVLPLERYLELDDFGTANDEYLHHAVELSARAVTAALGDAGLRAADVDAIITTSSTGVATPSLDARLANRIGLRPDVKRVPLFGLGCVGGVAGMARLHDYVRGDPDGVAVLVAVELCSLTLQLDDRSPANLVASGLFGDGAAAVVAVGDRRATALPGISGPEIVDSRSHLFPDTERVMGWDVGSGGLKIVLDVRVPELAREYLGDDVRTFLAGHDLRIPDVTSWVCHSGGPKVIEAMQEVLDLPPSAFELTWRCLAAIGNVSSPSVLHVLADTIDKHPPGGTPGMMIALGPGFCSELVLLRWR